MLIKTKRLLITQLTQQEPLLFDDSLTADLKRVLREGWEQHQARLRAAASAEPQGPLMQFIQRVNPAFLDEDYSDLPELEDTSNVVSRTMP